MTSGITSDSESFAFTTGAYGTRPTYLLTPTAKEESVTLYELLPEDVAQGRQERFDRKQKKISVIMTPVSEVIVGGDTPEEVADTDDSVGYQWSDWCAVKVCKLDTDKIVQLSGLVEDTLRDAGVDSTEIVLGCGETVCLPEAAGVRLTIAFIGIKPIRRNDKIRHIRDDIRQMSLGECYYWHSKIKSPNEPNGATALRELLSGHIN